MSVPLSVVTWRWKPPAGYRSTFGPETVNVLYRMVARHYPKLSRFICVTDDPKGIDKTVELMQDWRDYADLASPSGGHNPSCYRRLRAFHPEIGKVFGPRFVSMDLDMVITGDLSPVWDRPEDFVICCDTNPSTFYNGSMFLMTAGARAKVWTTFDPIASRKAAKAAGHHGSDQGHISHCLGPKEATWTRADGVYSYHNHLRATGVLPTDARVVVWHGHEDPWGRQARRLPWVQKYYQ